MPVKQKRDFNQMNSTKLVVQNQKHPKLYPVFFFFFFFFERPNYTQNGIDSSFIYFFLDLSVLEEVSELSQYLNVNDLKVEIKCMNLK